MMIGFRALGHERFVANPRGPQSLADLPAKTGAHAVTVEQAARRSELVVVTIPDARGLDEWWRQHPETPVYSEDFDADGVQRVPAQARNQRTPKWSVSP
jgi:hypothetical protein